VIHPAREQTSAKRNSGIAWMTVETSENIFAVYRREADISGE
jgi:hypothetical protein